MICVCVSSDFAALFGRDYVLLWLAGSIPQFNLASMTYSTSPHLSPETENLPVGMHWFLFFVYIFLYFVI